MLNELAEDQAHGVLATIYQEIRSTTSVPGTTKVIIANAEAIAAASYDDPMPGILVASA